VWKGPDVGNYTFVSLNYNSDTCKWEAGSLIGFSAWIAIKRDPQSAPDSPTGIYDMQTLDTIPIPLGTMHVTSP
jgi:hypothetical protein